MTNKRDVQRLLEGLNVDELLRTAVKDSLTRSIGEGYVAQPKAYNQTSETTDAKTSTAHKELYESFVKSLNRVAALADTTDKEKANDMHSSHRSTKADEARLLNAVWLHELFFANCFDPNSNLYMDSQAYLKLASQWGTFDAWQSDFIAAALAAGNGFAVTGYNLFLKQYVTTFVCDYADGMMLGLFPILVLDMHEHAYVREFANNKMEYVVACMREINWEVVEDRVKRAEAVAGALK